MSDRKSHLVALVAAIISHESGVRADEISAVVKFSCDVLDEIDAACIKASWSTGELAEAVARAVAAERERCAKIAEELELQEWEDKWIRSSIAAAIRRGGA